MPLRLFALARAVPAAALFFAASFASAKVAWKPVTPEELAEKAPQIEKEAPAEILSWTIEVDDRRFPEQRSTTEYIRYKIFAPDKVDAITRISNLADSSSSDRMEINARLVLPDGKIREFGKESLKDRTLAKQASVSGVLGWLASGGGPEVRERFLAISGVEAGAILEYQISRFERWPDTISVVLGQRDEIPVRKFIYSCRTLKDHEWVNRTFVSNAQGAKISEDPKTHMVTVTAENLPSVADEPMVGPATDYALTILSCYEALQKLIEPRSGKVPLPGEIDNKPGPWTGDATIVNWIERDRGFATTRVKKLAAELTQGLVDEAAKARAIHSYVEKAVQAYSIVPTPKPEERERVDSLDDLIDLAKKKNLVVARDDFLWFAIALYKSAGLECRTLMLPDRRMTRFNPRNVSPVFLPNRAAGVRIDGKWTWSAPHYLYPVPLGLLPWAQEGQVALLALARQQEFISIPAANADQSVIATFGNFTLDADGQLTGDVRRTFTGHAARELRGDLRAETNLEKRHALAADKLGFDLKKAEIKITRVAGLESADKTLEITGTVQWPGYATRTKERLVVRPAVFRAEATAPFAAATRRYPVHFHYRWQEVDDVRIAMPTEFQPEAPSSPGSIPGAALSYKTALGFDRTKHTLRAGREFVSNVIDISPDAYPQLKAWYDLITRADQHEVVFARKPAAAATAEK